MTADKQAWWQRSASWIKSRWEIALILCTAVIGTVWGWITARRKKELAEGQRAAEIAEALSEKDALEARREEVAARVEEKDEAILEIDDRIRAQKRRVLKASGEPARAYTDKELEDAFRRILRR